MKILVINSGSSSIKYKLFNMPSERVLDKGIIESIGESSSEIRNHHDGIKIILNKIKDVSAIGHRVVHGAENFSAPTILNDKVINDIKSCCKLAPLHNPANLAGILACKKLISKAPQVAVFDTAFHQTLPKVAFIYGLPYLYYEKFFIRKYGFHGTSHQFVAEEAAKILKKPLNSLNLISCHLGNGCSITAIKKGKSVDTSMGFTPLEGLLMGTRCGDIDPALIVHLQKSMGLTANEVDELLNKKSGLLGISGVSNDMRKVEASARASNKRARLAMDVFVYRIRKYIGAYTSVLGRVDAIIFTAGIGENQHDITRGAYKGLFDNLKKKPRVLIVKTNEELMIARQTYKLVRAK